MSHHCPFKIGEYVIYAPSKRGLGLEALSSEMLEPERRYKIAEIQNQDYLVVEGYHHPGGGLHWSEFIKCQ